MTIKLLDTVVLTKDMPEHRLKQGDVGAVVEVYPPDGIEVEFVTGSGRTQALITLKDDEVRPVGAADMLAVRKVDAA
ncbi:MAG: DUF4926 domain-containing protein [Gammaproteobacteria bacterium]|nr:DUF4926 domain-containing protein [Gammaproteobacteria bacterium]